MGNHDKFDMLTNREKCEVLAMAIKKNKFKYSFKGKAFNYKPEGYVLSVPDGMIPAEHLSEPEK